MNEISTISVADPGCLSRILDPNFIHLGSASKNLSILIQKIVSKLSDPGCSSRIPILIFYPSRIPDPGPGSKGHLNPDPDPHHCLSYSVPTHHEKSEKLQVPEDWKKVLMFYFYGSWFPVRFTKPTKGQEEKSNRLPDSAGTGTITYYWVPYHVWYYHYIVQYGTIYRRWYWQIPGKKAMTTEVTLDPHGKTRTIFLVCADPIRIRIFPSTSKKIRKNLDCYSFVTSFIYTCLKKVGIIYYLFSFKAVLRIHDIFVWIRIRIRGSTPLTKGSRSGCGSG